MVKVRKPDQKPKSATVRVLPALIAVATGALAFKAVDVARAIAAPVENEVQEEKPETALTQAPEGAVAGADAEEAPPGGAPAEGRADVCLPSIDYAAETGISGQELLVLRSLSQRREQLDQRSSELDTREQVAIAAEARVNTQIAELKSVQADMQKLANAMDVKRTEQMNALVKTYETMKPVEAARILNSMDDPQMLELAKAMKPAVLADVMSKMDTKRAVALTRMISDLAKPPPTVEALKQTAG